MSFGRQLPSLVADNADDTGGGGGDDVDRQRLQSLMTVRSGHRSGLVQERRYTWFT